MKRTIVNFFSAVVFSLVLIVLQAYAVYIIFGSNWKIGSVDLSLFFSFVAFLLAAMVGALLKIVGWEAVLFILVVSTCLFAMNYGLETSKLNILIDCVAVATGLVFSRILRSCLLNKNDN